MQPTAKLSALSACFLFAIAADLLAQQPAPSPPEITPENKQKYAAAAAVAAKDPAYLQAVKEVVRAQRAADRIFFEKLRQIEPDLKAYLEYLEKVRSSETSSPQS